MAAKRPTKTRKQIKEEFEELQESKPASSTTTKEKEQERARAETVRAAVANLSPEKLVSKVTALNFEMTRALSQVSEQLIQQTEELATVTEAVRLKKTEIEDLHGIDVAASATDVLIEEYQEREKTLEQEIAEKEAEWTARQRETEKSWKDLQDSARQQSKRAEEEYNYRTAIAQRLEQDKFAEEQRQLRMQEQIRSENLVRNWSLREEALKARETEVEALKKQVVEFPARLEAEIKKAEAIQTNIIASQYKHQAALALKDFEAVSKNSEMQIKSRDEQIAQLRTENTALNMRLVQAEEKVRTIAEKALDSASGQAALAEMRNTLMRPDANSQGRKSS